MHLTQQPHRFTVELDGGPGPIAGRLAEDGAVREFRGWLELMAAVDARRAAAAAGSSGAAAEA